MKGEGNPQIKEITAPVTSAQEVTPHWWNGRATVLEALLAEKPQSRQVRGLAQGHGAGGSRTWMPIPQSLRPPSPELLPGSTAGKRGLCAGPALSAPKLHGLWNRAVGLPARGKLPMKVLTSVTLG